MQAETHIWKTSDGELVASGDTRAASLAYAPGDEVDAKDADKVRALGEGTESTAGSQGQDGEDQQQSQPALSDQPTKQRTRATDKSAQREGDK